MPSDVMISQEAVIERMEAAGRALLSLPASGYTTRLRTSKMEYLREPVEQFSETAGRFRPPAPSSEELDRMDEAFGWLALIPDSRYMMRRIVGARSLVHPLTCRYVFSWRRIALMLGADHKAVQRWHGEGIRLICEALGNRG